MPTRKAAILVSLGMLCLFLIGFSLISHSSAAPISQEPPTATPEIDSTPQSPAEDTAAPNLSISDQVCLDCHGSPGQTMLLENGEELDLFVPAELHQGSVHGELGYACVQCHTNVGEYPHPAFSASDRRDITLQLDQVCARCHSLQFELSHDSVHATAQSAGIREAAVCSDCHTAHEVRRLNDPNTHELLPDAKIWIPQRCALCHNAIYQEYEQSVHGSALSEGNSDVPTCIDCHGVHNIPDPRTANFRLRSPQICAGCHTDPKVMDKYGITTAVLDTYVSDFHGATVAIFERQSPDAEVNKPVCYDCHGVHAISRTDDPNTGIAMKENMLKRCQLCHPDATANFPSAWMSHYIPSPEHYPLVFYVDLFYKFFIPAVLGFMALLVVMDSSRLVINRRRVVPKQTQQSEEEFVESAHPSSDLTNEHIQTQEDFNSIQDQPKAEPLSTVPENTAVVHYDEQPAQVETRDRSLHPGDEDAPAEETDSSSTDISLDQSEEKHG